MLSSPKKDDPLPPDHVVPYDELVRELRRLSREGRSGTLFIATGDNRLARVAFRGGIIVGVAFQRKVGMEAIEALRGIASGSCRFNEQVMLVHGGESLPPTPHILQLLTESVDIAFDLTPRAVTPPAPERAVSLAELTDVLQIKEMITSGLTEVMGPMAALVCEEHLSGCTDRKSAIAAIDRIAAEIGEPRLENQFKMWVADRLRKMQER